MKKAVIALSAVVVLLLGAVAFMMFSGNDIELSADQLNDTEIRINSYADSGNIVSVAEARELMAARNNIVVLDIRKAVDYAVGHVPGAQNIFRGDYSASSDVYGFGGMRADRAQLEALLGRLGVTADTQILAYDAKGDYDAARFWWQLSHFGFDNVRLIDGGIIAWENAGFEMTSAVPTVEPTQFSFPQTWSDESNLATLDDVIAAIDDPNVVILDTRTIEEMEGSTTKNGAFRAGRIPSSVWLEWTESLAGDKTFLDVDTLRARFAEIGVTPDKTIIAYCQSGVRSAHTTFVLSELLGFPSVMNFDGSWIEWSYNEQLPLETGTMASNGVAVASN